MSKTLYFEGAGCVPAGDLENCRIRTAFTNDSGDKIYLEILSCKVTKLHKKCESFKYYNIGDVYGSVDACYYITNDRKIDDCNKSKLGGGAARNAKMHYTKNGILNFVNNECDCSFDDIQICNQFSGYRCFSDTSNNNDFSSYNFSEDFVYNANLEKKREEKAKELSDEYKYIFNAKNAPISVYVKNNELTCRIYASDEAMKKAGIPEENREFIVEL